MIQRARGTFDVALTPQEPGDAAAGVSLDRMAINKQFHGDLVGNSTGQMLRATTSVAGSAGYVAIERVSGVLHGRSGSFVLQHNGIMARGAPQLTINIVPDSGTGALVGIAGTMTIAIADGEHSYELAYTFAGEETSPGGFVV